MQINDNMSLFLTVEGFNGSVQDQYKAWLKREGLGGGTDELYAYYLSQGVKRGSINDMSLAFFSGTRFFTTLVASGSMHYIIPTVTLTGDFDVTVETALSTAVAEVIVGDAANLTWLRINANGSVQIKGAGVGQVSAAGLYIFDGKLQKNRVNRTGTTITWYINEVLVHTFPGTYSGDFIFDRLAQKAGVNFLDGILANVAIDDAGTPVRLYPLDENFGETAVVKNSLAVLGPELYAGGIDTGVNGGTFTDNGDGTFTVTGTGNDSSGASDQTFPTVVGRTYLMTADPVSGLAPRFAAFNLSFIRIGSGVGELAFTATETVTKLYITPASAGSTTYSNVSLKQADGYGTAVNISESDLFTLQSNGDYLGVEKVVNGGFSDALNGWTNNGGWSAGVNEAIATNLDSGTKTLSQSGLLDVGTTYLLSYTGAVDTGTLGMQTDGGAVAFEFRISTSVTSISEPWVADNTSVIFKRQSTVNNGSLDNVSVKQLLESA